MSWLAGRSGEVGQADGDLEEDGSCTSFDLLGIRRKCEKGNGRSQAQRK